MKKNYITALLSFFTFSTFAQTTPKDSITKADSLKIIPNLVTVASATNVYNILPQLSPKSPNVASLGRYGEYPVNLNTGLPTIEIPIFNIEAGGLSFPVKLSYHASGVKVTDVANFVGLGWSLQYNGSVNRQLRGVADESSNGLLGQTVPVDIQAFKNAVCYNEDVRDYYERLSTNNIDAERDIFSISLPNKSNQFILRNVTDYQWLMPEPTKVVFSKPNSQFTITDEKGQQYFFNDKEITTSVGVSTWLLSQAQGVRSQDRIIWEYNTATNYTWTHDIVESITVNDNSSGTVPNNVTLHNSSSSFSPTLTSINTSVEQRLPKTIHFPTGKVEFVYETTDRQDGYGKALDKIEIYGYNITTLAYELIKTYDLTYVYRNRSDNSPVLFLDQVRMLDNANTEIGKYQLGYETTQTLPARNSKARDYWGYYNGATSNSTLIPSQSIAYSYTTGSGTINFSGGNREPDESYMKAWVLNKITYPTGGYSEFSYEANRYLSGSILKQAGGLRIVSINSLPSSTGTGFIKSYKYGTNENGAGTLRTSLALGYNTEHKVISCQPNTTGAVCAEIYSYRIRTYTSNLSGALFPTEGSPVTYPKVTEYQQVSGGNGNGKTVYDFRESSDNVISLNRGAKYFVNSKHWNRGQLETKSVYGNDNLLKYKLVFCQFNFSYLF